MQNCTEFWSCLLSFPFSPGTGKTDNSKIIAYTSVWHKILSLSIKQPKNCRVMKWNISKKTCHFSILLAWTSSQCLICKSNWYTIDTLPKITFCLLLMLCFLQWQLGKVHSCGWNCFNFLQMLFNFKFCCTSANQTDYFWLSCKGLWAIKFTFPHFHLIKILEKKSQKNNWSSNPQKIFSLFSSRHGSWVLPFSD